MNKDLPERRGTLNERTAAVIRGHMAQQKRTTVALAAVLKISRQSAGRKAGGATAITLNELEIIAGWLQTTPDALVAEAEKG